jgi:hypothetical protein
MAFVREDQPIAETLVVSLATILRNESRTSLRNDASPNRFEMLDSRTTDVAGDLELAEAADCLLKSSPTLRSE